MEWESWESTSLANLDRFWAHHNNNVSTLKGRANKEQLESIITTISNKKVT
jgi:hypothetical protein